MCIRDRKIEEYIAGLNKEEFAELAKELGEKISKIFHNELRKFFEELKKDDDLEKAVKVSKKRKRESSSAK